MTDITRVPSLLAIILKFSKVLTTYATVLSFVTTPYLKTFLTTEYGMLRLNEAIPYNIKKITKNRNNSSEKILSNFHQYLYIVKMISMAKQLLNFFTIYVALHIYYHCFMIR